MLLNSYLPTTILDCLLLPLLALKSPSNYCCLANCLWHYKLPSVLQTALFTTNCPFYCELPLLLRTTPFTANCPFYCKLPPLLQTALRLQTTSFTTNCPFYCKLLSALQTAIFIANFLYLANYPFTTHSPPTALSYLPFACCFPTYRPTLCLNAYVATV
jgi:hypothetical protein